MSYTVSATDLKNIRFSENDAINAVLQNVAVILSTPKGSVPLYRDFGIDWSILDKPGPAAEVLLRPEVKEAVEQWEPRATVLSVTFTKDASQPGGLNTTVEVEIDAES